MRLIIPVFLACVLTVSVFAQTEKTNAQLVLKKTAEAEVAPAVAVTPGLTFSATAGVVSAPFVATNGYIFQPNDKTEVTEGGKAVYDFTIVSAGDYVIQTVVNAPAEDSNSFFLNIDGPPTDPLMIWDIDVTTGFEERAVSWRGDGAADSDQFAPKRFTLTPGKHQLVIIGREPEAQLKTISIRPAGAK